MNDTLRIKNLRFYGYHGELQVEKEGGQIFEADVEINFDQFPSAEQDDLSRGVDVREIYRRIRGVLKGPSCNLVETLAQNVAEEVLDMPLVEGVTVRIRKPSAYKYDPEEPGYEVEIFRTNKEGE